MKDGSLLVLLSFALVGLLFVSLKSFLIIFPSAVLLLVADKYFRVLGHRGGSVRQSQLKLPIFGQYIFEFLSRIMFKEGSEVMLGDLLEVYADRQRRFGIWNAKLWSYRETLSLIVAFLRYVLHQSFIRSFDRILRVKR
jgi:hypothetical protein